MKWYLLPHNFENYSFEDVLKEFGLALFNAFLLIPGALAFSSLAGVQPLEGLLSAVFPGFFYFFIGSFRQMSVGKIFLFF
jgi:MFS superfamily sulfate permease-like transporter